MQCKQTRLSVGYFVVNNRVICIIKNDKREMMLLEADVLTPQVPFNCDQFPATDHTACDTASS